MSKKKIPVRTPNDANSKKASQPPEAGSDDVSTHEDPAANPSVEWPDEERSDAANSTADENVASQLRAELESATDRALRCQAELENYRRRAAREMEQQQRYAALPLLRDLLPVWDNVRRAIEAAEQAGASEALLQGFSMVATQLEDVLRRHDCEKIDALYHPFDPNLHEAITQQPSSEHPPGTVVGETQTGFRLHDRVVRASQVIVSVPMPSEAGKDDGDDTNNEDNENS